jgi:hypothetical protein
VGNLTNREWQGDKFKQDPCYLKLTKDVLGKKASTATLGISVGIANATRGLEHRNLAE